MPNHGFNIANFQSHWDGVFSSTLSHGSDGPGAAFHAESSILGTPIYSNGFGKASVANDIDFTVNTPCPVRSVTKTLTQALMLKAEDTVGNIIDSPISSFSIISNNLPRWENRFIPINPNTSERYRPPIHQTCTPKQIATHTANFDPAGKYTDTSGKHRPVYAADRSHWLTSGPFSEWRMADNAYGQKNQMETITTIDDLVAMAGAVCYGMADPNNWTPWQFVYLDKAAWLSGAIIEETLGNSWFNLIQEQFDFLGGTAGLPSSYPSFDGNASYFLDNGNWRSVIKGHNANPIEIAGMAVPYRRGPVTTKNPKGLYLEPEQSTESGYAIGCAAMSAEDLANWAMELRWPSGSTSYLTQSSIDKMFSSQTGYSDRTYTAAQNANSKFPSVNYGFGTYKLVPVTGTDGLEVPAYGGQGQGGWSGAGGAMVWLEGRDIWTETPHHVVFAGVSNTINSAGVIDAQDVYEMAKDFAANFLRSP